TGGSLLADPALIYTGNASAAGEDDRHARPGSPGEDGDLVAQVLAGDVEGGIGLGVASPLGLRERACQVAAAGDGIEAEAGRPVEHTLDAGDGAFSAGRLDELERRCRAADCSAVQQAAAVGAGEGFEVGPALGNEGLVGRDDIPAAAEGGFDQFAGGLRAADEFDDDVAWALDRLPRVGREQVWRDEVGVPLGAADGDGGDLEEF